MGTTIWRQTWALFHRNLVLKLRSPVQVSQELFFPLFFVIVLLIIAVLLPVALYPAVPSFPERDPLRVFDPSRSDLLVVFSPNSPQDVAVVNRASLLLAEELEVAEIPVLGFVDEEELDIYVKENPTGFWAAVLLDLSMASSPSVSIRMNSTSIPSSSSSFSGPTVCRLTEENLPTSCPTNGYLNSGFVNLQAALNRALYEVIVLSGADSGVTMETIIQQRPKEEYLAPDYVLGYIAPIYLVLAMSPLFQYLLVNLVVEKEKKMMEIMQMAGMRTLAFFGSWLMVYALEVLLVTLMMTVILTQGGVFPRSDFLIIYLLLLLFGLSLLSFGLMISTFFNKSKVAGAIGSFLNVILSMLFIPLSGLGTAAPGAALWATSLIPSVAFPVGASIVVNFEYAAIGVHWDNINDTRFTPGFSVASTMIMFTVDIFLYLFLAWYLEAVIPSSYGTKLPPWFIFLPSYWFPSSDKVDFTQNVEMASDGVEEVPEQMKSKAVIQISELHKRYSGLLFYTEIKYAINGVSLNLYEDQIFGLLGHNGAGKSSLISILSGTNPQSSGSISMYGYDTKRQMFQIREMMGICPQENVLHDKLSVQEHLRFFGGLRGLSGSQLENAIKEMLHDVDLTEQASARAITLSGGQKRKLCLGMAMIGDPKILLLDEPTSGMDPYSRRKIWDLLQKKKKNHVTLLTTHSMDEADILADRKAVLSGGKVRCIGSSLFLKSKFGLGYHLNIMTSEKAAKSSTILDLIHRSVPDAQLTKQTGTALTCTLPLSSSQDFPALFASIEESQDALGITGFFVSMTSLEEVFLNLQEEEAAEKQKAKDPKGAEASAGRVIYSSADSPLLPPQDTIVTIGATLPPVEKEKATFKTKLFSMIYYRLRQVPRNYRGYVFSVAFPVYFLVIGMIFFTLVPSTAPVQETAQPLNASRYPNEPIFFANSTGGSLDNLLIHVPKVLQEVPSDGFYETVSNSSDLSWAFEVSENTPTSLHFHTVYDDTLTHILPVSIQVVSEAFYSSLAEIAGFGSFKINLNSYPYPIGDIPFDTTSYVAILMIGNAMIFAACGFPSDVVKEREFKLKHQLSVMGLSSAGYWLSNFARDFLLLSIPAVLVIVLIWAFNVTALIGPAFLAVLLLLILFMFVMIIFAYLLSFLFDRYETSQTVLPVLVNFLGLVPYVLVAGLDLAGVRDIAKALHYIFCVINPAYIFFGGLHYISSVNLYALLLGTTPTVGDYFDPANNILQTLLIMVAQLVITTIACYVYYRRGLITPDSSGSMSETTTLLSEVPRKEEKIVARNLHKTFAKPTESFNPLEFMKKTKEESQKVVVDDVSLVVKEGECLGLLGPNGAGKTTTLNMLTGAETPSSGRAYISGYDIAQSKEALFELLGYCPQHDALFDDLTVKEHLCLFATIKGIARSHIEKRADAFIAMMGMTPHTNSTAKTLSGGTKRKLSFAISLIGDPSVLILDEPSSGMDPASRRDMWELVKMNISGKASVLTTHSMEEAEELSTKIGILIKGNFECMGTAQELKNKFGDGYQLDVKLPTGLVENFKGFLATHFEHHSLVEEHYGRLTYRIQAHDLPLSKIFGLFERNRKALQIEDYSFSQTTLEQVFISFAKKQDTE